ncbi:hypothetical protein LCGC14_2918260 [marine sediment metagenome]|uniref:Uncharacterized protein n=1 Tax=marine sediment metagenome TaxID=412755 RepID=A0A0F8YBH2_9ZZZZ
MTFTMSIESTNAAFEDEGAEEVTRILRHVADQIKDGYTVGPVLDSNGNSVGVWSFDDGEHE